jgi:hypothetical protein
MRKPINVKDLIQKAPLLKKQAAQFFDIEQEWRVFLDSRLPDGLAEQIAGIGCHPPELVVYAGSSAWSARLRYALVELEGAIRERDPALHKVIVRVQPATRAAKASARSRR